MSVPPFRDLSDPDEKRKEILWIAISFIVILASWLAVVLILGYQPLVLGMSYDEAVLMTGLGLLVFCSILYLAGREREQRYTNRRLLAELQATVTKLDERLRQLNGLCSTSAELAGSLEAEQIARLTLGSLRANLEGDAFCIMLMDEQTGRLLYSRCLVSDSPAGEASLADLATVWPELYAHSQRARGDLSAQLQAWNELGCVACAPLNFDSGLTGLLAARRSERTPHFTLDDFSLLTTLANMTASAIQSAQLHTDLRESYLATVRSLVYSLDARDNYAASHGQRVAALAVRIAEHMGLPDSTLRDMEVFGPLHDVGKIGIPDSILLKAGPLSEDDKATFRDHCLIGERILRPLKPDHEALSLVRSHHESYDGEGYPDALVGAQIPLPARILKVADCYDALISERPYRPALSDEEALSHFQLHAGVRYDPTVVEALGALLREGAPTPQPSDSPLPSTERAAERQRAVAPT